VVCKCGERGEPRRRIPVVRESGRIFVVGRTGAAGLRQRSFRRGLVRWPGKLTRIGVAGSPRQPAGAGRCRSPTHLVERPVRPGRRKYVRSRIR